MFIHNCHLPSHSFLPLCCTVKSENKTAMQQPLRLGVPVDARTQSSLSCSCHGYWIHDNSWSPGQCHSVDVNSKTSLYSLASLIYIYVKTTFENIVDLLLLSTFGSYHGHKHRLNHNCRLTLNTKTRENPLTAEPKLNECKRMSHIPRDFSINIT